MKNKYVIIEMTNGQGYSDPTVMVFTNKEDAQKHYFETIGMLMMQDMTVVKSEIDHFICEDAEEGLDDSCAVYFYEFDYFKWYALRLSPDILDFNYSIISIPSLEDIINGTEFDFDDDIEKYDENENATFFGAHTNNAGYIHLQII